LLGFGPGPGPPVKAGRALFPTGGLRFFVSLVPPWLRSPPQVRGRRSALAILTIGWEVFTNALSWVSFHRGYLLFFFSFLILGWERVLSAASPHVPQTMSYDFFFFIFPFRFSHFFPCGHSCLFVLLPSFPLFTGTQRPPPVVPPPENLASIPHPVPESGTSRLAFSLWRLRFPAPGLVRKPQTPPT